MSYFEHLDLSEVAVESHKTPVQLGLERYVADIQNRGMSKQIYREVEALHPGILNDIDPMRLTIHPSNISKQVAIEAISFGMAAGIGILFAITAKILHWIFKKLFGDKDSGGSSTLKEMQKLNAEWDDALKKINEQEKEAEQTAKEVSQTSRTLADELKVSRAILDKYENNTKPVDISKIPTDSLESFDKFMSEEKPVVTPAVVKKAVTAAANDSGKTDEAKKLPKLKNNPNWSKEARKAINVSFFSNPDKMNALVALANRANGDVSYDPLYKKLPSDIDFRQGRVFVSVCKMGFYPRYKVADHLEILEIVNPDRGHRLINSLTDIAEDLVNLPKNQDDVEKWESNALKSSRTVSAIFDRYVKEDNFKMDGKTLDISSFVNKLDTVRSRISRDEKLDVKEALKQFNFADIITNAQELSYNAPATLIHASDEVLETYRILEQEAKKHNVGELVKKLDSLSKQTTVKFTPDTISTIKANLKSVGAILNCIANAASYHLRVTSIRLAYLEATEVK